MKEENGTRLSEFGLGVILRFFCLMGGVAEKEVVGLTETRWGTTRDGGNRERRYNFMLEHRVFAAELYFVETSEILTEVITFLVSERKLT